MGDESRAVVPLGLIDPSRRRHHGLRRCVLHRSSDGSLDGTLDRSFRRRSNARFSRSNRPIGDRDINDLPLPSRLQTLRRDPGHWRVRDRTCYGSSSAPRTSTHDRSYPALALGPFPCTGAVAPTFAARAPRGPRTPSGQTCLCARTSY
jgi:hypothetical protein